jgi:hypothetical protein
MRSAFPPYGSTALLLKFTVRQAEARAVKEVELFVDVAPE